MQLLGPPFVSGGAHIDPNSTSPSRIDGGGRLRRRRRLSWLGDGRAEGWCPVYNGLLNGLREGRTRNQSRRADSMVIPMVTPVRAAAIGKCLFWTGAARRVARGRFLAVSCLRGKGREPERRLAVGVRLAIAPHVLPQRLETVRGPIMLKPVNPGTHLSIGGDAYKRSPALWRQLMTSPVIPLIVFGPMFGAVILAMVLRSVGAVLRSRHGPSAEHAFALRDGLDRAHLPKGRNGHALSWRKHHAQAAVQARHLNTSFQNGYTRAALGL
jgi:hypothetical protein